MIFKNWKYMKYTFKHKIAFLLVEKQLLGKNTLKGLLHDLDKLIMYIFLSKEKVKNIHVKHSKHHDKAKNKDDYAQMIIDFESCRLSKSDKPLDAYETLNRFYLHDIRFYDLFMMCEELGLPTNSKKIYDTKGLEKWLLK